MKTGFVVSTGRTGTNFFTHFFNKYVDGVWSAHEPQPAFKRRSFELVQRDYTLYEKYYFKIPRLLRHLRRDEKVYIESNYHLFSVVPLLRNAFPEPSIIHVIRDGRDVVRSWLNRGWFLSDPGSKLTPDSFKNDSSQAKWDEWNALQKISWYWKRVNSHIESYNPDLTVYFENIFQNERNGIPKILNLFDGLEADEQTIDEAMNTKVNKTTHKLIPKYPKWPDFWKDQFWNIAGEKMKALGFQRDYYPGRKS